MDINKIRLEIYSESKALEKVRRGYIYDYIVSISDPWESEEDKADQILVREYLGKACKELFYLEFVDDNISPNISPNISHVNKLVEISHKFKEHNYTSILFHCQGGISRSPASAIIFLQNLGFSKKESYQKVLSIAPRAKPNKLLLSL